ncbi:MAG: Ig-like domain-containing protein, partial [Prevotellaceae bacterium]|nr:Ig-like domain-containing protein [Prevotellaceae bacterium]
MKKKLLSLIALVALAVGITVAVNYVPSNGLKLLGKSEKAEFAGKLNSSSIDICKNVDMKGMSVKKGTMPKTADEGWGEWAEFAPGGSNDAVWTLTAWQTGTLNVKTYVRTSTADATKKQIKCAGWGADLFTDAGVDILLDWNTTDNTIEIPMQSTGYYVSNYKDYAVLGTFKTGKYDPEQGQFSFHVGYSVPQYYVMGKGFGFGDETLQMAGNFKDYSLSFSRGTVDDVATPIKQTINVYPGADITSYRVHVDTYENYAAAQGSAAYFEALAKAEGTDYTDPSATVELKGSAYNIYVVVVSAFVGTEMKKYAYDMYEVSPASDWETIGLRPYREDIVTSLYNFGITGPVYNVEVQKHKTYRDIYRIKNPYGSTSPFKGYTLYENAYLYLNAQNPTKVSPTFQLSRCDLGIDVEGGMPLNVLLADDEVGGTFDGYAISFPTRALVSNNYYVNTNGLFRAVINFRDAEFAFADSVESVYTGETVKIISNNTLSVPTFESLTPEIATVDAKGVVTAVAPGKAQIKVVQDAILEFNAKETVMEIDVKKNPNSYASFVFNTDEGLAALGIEKPAASAATNLTGMTLTSGDVSMTSTDGGTATRVWNTNDVTDLRMYKNGGSFTFSVPDGYKIISIDFT